MTLVEFNRQSDSQAQTELLRCCASHRWAQLMAAERPFANFDVMAAVAQRLWWSLAVADWLEAFAAHPRIGERATSAWSEQEQARARESRRDVRERLAAGNRSYEERFGYTFLVCATDKTADEILAVLERRLHNEPGDELQVAADEQRKIMILRLEKLIAEKL
jgi:2-oxo-4-hydroxy-4-carboxy-5-ureidoimidazoline decarboxylase